MTTEELKKKLEEIYLQGWLDRDWGIGQDTADENAEKYANAVINKLGLDKPKNP